MTNVRDLMAQGRHTLAGAAIAAPGREAARLLGTLLGLSEVQVRAREEQPVEAQLAGRFAALVARRAAGCGKGLRPTARRGLAGALSP